MVFVPWLADAARSTGYRTVEVGGWRTRGHGGMRLVEGVVGHHTATPASAGGDYPSLNIVTNGRSDLAGPLCNLGLGRDGTIYVVAAGTAWHAGASAWAGFNDLNDEFLGIEAESPGQGQWTDAQRDAYPKLVAALLRYMNRPVSRYAGHKDVCLPHGRKPDPVGIDTEWMRARVTQIWNPPAGGGSTPGTPIELEEDEDMGGYYPLVADAAPEYKDITLPWNGKAGVLNVIADGADIELSHAPWCWGPNGGTGGGESATDPTPGTIEVNKPGAYRIPANCTRIFVSYKSDTRVFFWPVAS